jgi:hypothetical protein
MAGQTGNQNTTAWKLISGSLNGENNAGLGSPIAYGGIPGALVSQYAGFLGTKYTFSADDAGKLSNTAIGTLYGGTYQMVRIAPAAVQANLTRGRLVFWDTSVSEDSYQVTNDETQNGGQPLFAGVLIGAPTAGNYCIIQTKGRATVQMRATVTAATRDLTWAAAGAGVDNATFDGLAGATALTGANIQKQLATGEAVAANGALIIATLSPMWFVERN